MSESENPQPLHDKDFSVQNWWDEAHSTDHPTWLSGSNETDIWKRLDVDGLVKAGAKVLNIGVGLGNCTYALNKRGCEVHALDISPVALKRVETLIKAGYLTKDLPSLPIQYFDLAISHLVAQHMNDENLRVQITNVLRALKPNGVFAMQIAYRMNRVPNSADGTTTMELEKGGGICRSLFEFVELVESVGGNVEWAERTNLFEEAGSGWYCAHIRREGSSSKTALKDAISFGRTLNWEIADLNEKNRPLDAAECKSVRQAYKNRRSVEFKGLQRIIFQLLA